MRYAVTALLMLAVLANAQWAGPSPIGKNENNILYTWDGLDFELQLGNVGYASYTTTTNATTDTVKVLYMTEAEDHAEVWLRFSAQNQRTANAGIMYATVMFSPILERTAITAADTVSVRSLTTGALLDGPINRTFTIKASENTTLSQIGMFTPEQPLVIGPLRATPSGETDVGFGFYILPVDSMFITWEMLTIPRD